MVKFALLAPLALALVAAQLEGPPTLSTLARDVERAESVREVKDVQRTFAQLAQAGRWADMAGLFAADGTLRWGKGTNTTTVDATGPAAVEAWLRTDAGTMDGVRPGSLNTLVAENPVVNLAVDGRTARGRWNVLHLMGDGRGRTRIEGGIFENQFVLEGQNGTARWKISRLDFSPLYGGTYSDGWRTAESGAVVPYHFSPAQVGVPAPLPSSRWNVSTTNATLDQLDRRIALLNAEDDVRNLQAAYGYYADRRMWDDVVDLFAANGTAQFAGNQTNNIRAALEAEMGPAGLSSGILNDRPQFDTVVRINSDGRSAVARGIEIGMLGDVGAGQASWAFSVFRNRFVLGRDGSWRIAALESTPLMQSIYLRGWGDGDDRGGPAGPTKPTAPVPPFLDVGGRTARASRARGAATADRDNIAALRRRLARSEAFDGAENASNGYGYYLDDLDCEALAAVHAQTGHKESPFAGWYRGRDRIEGACKAAWGNTSSGNSSSNSTTGNSSPRSSIAFHWRPQPVIIVSQDGRSASIRARLLQPTTSTNSSEAGLGAAMYHDQAVLEDGAWRLWSVTIDEHYWQTGSWQTGWVVSASNTSSSPSALLSKYPPDVTLVDVGDREASFRGGSGATVSWPSIQRMWFAYRNPVSGRQPAFYWPGCVPCQARREWSLLQNDYQEPPTGPTSLRVTHGGSGPGDVTVVVSGGPDEPVQGDVAVVSGNDIRLSAGLPPTGILTLALPEGLEGKYVLGVSYLGSDRLRPAEATITINVS